MSKIEWTHIPGYKGTTLNCVTGCTKFSIGCAHCYSEKMTFRLQKMWGAKISKGEDPGGLAKYKDGFGKVNLHYDMLRVPERWRKPRAVFLNSMSDTFHPDVHNGFLFDMFTMMRVNGNHIFMVLTKRSERLSELAPRLEWYGNIWMGVSVESADYKYRIDHLRSTGAKTKFLSLEPLLGPMGHLNLTGIQWAIIGSESGPGARPMKEEWVREIIAQCKDAGVAIFYKQKQTAEGKISCPSIDGLQYKEFPKENTHAM